MIPHKPSRLLFLVCFFVCCSQALAEPQIKNVIAELDPRISEHKAIDMSKWKKVSTIHMLVPDFFLPQQIADMNTWLSKNVGANIVLLKSAQELTEVQDQVEALVGWCGYLNGDFPKLVWLQNLSAGVESCASNKQFNNDRVLLTNGASTHGPAIAEWVIGAMFMLKRQFIDYYQQQAKSNWVSQRQSIPAGTEANGKTMLIVGLGGIGRQIAWRANGLGMRVIATRNSSRSGPEYVDYVGLANELDTLVSQADVVVNATPLTDSTRNMFNKTLFSKMKSSAIFINIGRGGSVVQPDLIAALKSGIIRGAALDVTSPEPLPKDSELWQLPNVFITPHHSSRTQESRLRLWLFVRENMRRLVAGEKIYNLVDFERGY